MQRLHLLLGALAITTISCANPTVKSDDSNLNQMSERPYKCNLAPEDQAMAVTRDAPQGLFVGWSAAEETLLRQYMSALPDEYLKIYNAAKAKNNFTISKVALGGNIAGLTQFNTTDYPNWVQVAPGQIDYAYVHELGHAIYPYVKNHSNGQLGSELVNAYNRERNTAGILWYPKTGVAEWFADSFQSFYCSKEAQQFMETKIPETAAMLQKHLKPARWADGGGVFAVGVYNQDLNNTNGNFRILISAPKDVDALQLCRANKVDCQAGKGEIIPYKLKTTIKYGRKIFETDIPFTLATFAEPFTVIGKKVAGASIDDASLVREVVITNK